MGRPGLTQQERDKRLSFGSYLKAVLALSRLEAKQVAASLFISPSNLSLTIDGERPILPRADLIEVLTLAASEDRCQHLRRITTTVANGLLLSAGYNPLETEEISQSLPNILVITEATARELESGLAALPDILTPGTSDEEFITAYTPHFGHGHAQKLLRISGLSIRAIEDGDFDHYIELGRQIEEEAHGVTEVQASGIYLIAEGYRLQADMENDDNQKRHLLYQAAEQYGLSLEKYPGNPSPIRGRARVYEVQGNLEEALHLYEKAKGIALARLASSPRNGTSRQLSHEILRTSRHYVHCIVEMMNANPLSVWRKENKKRQLEGYVVESENLHTEHMVNFQRQQRWSQIEWFMGLVLLSKAWCSLGNYTRMIQCLLQALWARRIMIGKSRSLTNIERANIKWWLSVATSEPRSSTVAGFYAAAERLGQALESNDGAQVLQRIDDLILPVIPPWQLNRGEQQT